MLIGPEDLDDAGVMDLGDGRVLVQTVDFFPPIVDTPREFGQIAAANALSDIYAMGAVPFSALNIVGFPAKQLGLEVLGEILAGGADKLREAETALIGGHTVEDSEIKYGLSVTGLAQRGDIIANGGAQPGDRLLLSKPLGMGAVSTSIQRDKADPEHVAAAVQTMATLNAGAARAMRSVGARAATDITGFGLLGHASEMARASGQTLRFNAGHLPFTPGARELAGRRILSGGVARTRRYLAGHFAVGSGVPQEVADLAFDAETSGGLLIAVAAERADQLRRALESEGTPCAVDIGEVIAAQGDVWVVLE